MFIFSFDLSLFMLAGLDVGIVISTNMTDSITHSARISLNASVTRRSISLTDGRYWVL